MSALLRLDAFSRARVAVIGDIMLDHYIHGSVRRISPEAPVPVVLVGGERHSAGGAANVAANAAALGASVSLTGLVGADPAAIHLRAALAAWPSVAFAPVASAERPTIVKTRLLGGHQQIARMDREAEGPCGLEDAGRLEAAAREAMTACDVAVLSDYGKGALGDNVLRAALAAARAAGIPVIVDPKRLNFSDYASATILTPNRGELEAATGLPAVSDADAERAARRAMEASGAMILLTRSERGMSLFRPGLPPLHMPTRARDVFDVSGAGDTVVAALAVALASGAPIEAAMHMANCAAGIVVGRVGTAVCTRGDLAEALRSERAAAPEPDTGGGYHGAVGRDAAARRRAEWRAAGLSVGFANGCFDLLHPGHVRLLAEAASRVDRLIVAINSDASVARLKGPSRPVQTDVSRAAVLAGLASVDLVTVFEEDTPLDLIRALMPDVLFKGADYAGKEVVGRDVVEAAGGQVVLIDLVDGQSTSALVGRMRDG